MKFNQENYEEYALDYLENNLTAEDRAEFEVFLLLHPKIQESLIDFEMVTLSDDPEIGFPNKQRLLREEGGSIIFFSRKIIAIAASVLFLLAAGYYLGSRSTHNSTGDVVQLDQDLFKSTPETSTSIKSMEPIDESDKPTLAQRSKQGAEKINATRPTSNPTVKEHPQGSILEGPSAPLAQVEDLPRANYQGQDAPLTQLDAHEVTSNQMAAARETDRLSTASQGEILDPVDALKGIAPLPQLEIASLPEKQYAIHVADFSNLIPDPAEAGPSKLKKFLTKANLLPRDLASVDVESFKSKLLPESIAGLK